jgi:dTDP-4-dehydrorhamnose reductase
MDKDKISQTFGVNIPYWEESLKTCIEILKEK